MSTLARSAFAAALSASAAGALTLPLGAQVPHEVIYTEIPSSPTSLIPGAAGARFGALDDIDQSPNGAHWTLHARSTSSSSFDNHFIADGALVLREFFSTLPWDPSQGWRGGRSRVNDAGQIALAAESAGSPRYIVRGDSAGQGAWTVLRREGDTVTGSAAAWTQFFAASITTDARVGFAGSATGSLRAASFDGATVALTQSTVPAGSSSGGALTQIDPADFGLQVSADGSTWAFLGAVGGVNALIVNNQVALEVGQPVPGAGFTRDILRVTGHSVDPSGRSFGWGLNEVDNRDWVVRDGVVLAEEFDPIVPGSSELWGNTSTLNPGFFHAVGNRAGDYVIVGRTRASADIVLVLNGETVLARGGDPIDVDGNGLFDDNAVLGGVSQIGGFGDDGSLLAIVTLFTPGLTQLGDALVRFDVPTSGLGSVYCSSTPNSTGTQAALTLSGSALVADNNLTLTCAHLPTQSFGYFLTGRVQASVPNAGGSQGTLCLGGAVGRGVGGGAQNSGATGSVAVSADLSALPSPTGPVMALAGETWSFQYWYRDANPTVTSNLSPGVALTLQ